MSLLRPLVMAELSSAPTRPAGAAADGSGRACARKRRVTAWITVALGLVAVLAWLGWPSALSPALTGAKDTATDAVKLGAPRPQ